jgi:hypothetical protein
MLTYDQCFPHTIQDAIALSKKKEAPAEYPLLEQTPPEEPSITIELTAINTDPRWQPLIAHWNKHGWSIGAVRQSI